MRLQSPLSAIAGDTVGIWKVSHILSPLGSPIVRANLTVGYSCLIKAVDALGSVVVAERPVTTISQDGSYFLAALNPTETAGLLPGIVTVAIQLSHPGLTPPLRKESHYYIEVSASINSNT